MCILDLSKTLMYDFHYNYIKGKYGSRAKLLILFTHTDSLTYEIQAKDVYKDFWEDREKFDNIDCGKDNKYFEATNEKVIGKFKMRLLVFQLLNLLGSEVKCIHM